MSERVIVFIDYENLRFSARDQFHRFEASRTDGHIDPASLARLLVQRRNTDSQLSQVRVYRGRPSPIKQPSAAAASDAQAAAWASRDPLLTHIVRRDLRYPANYPLAAAQEKGVDVALAVDFVRLAYEGAYDAGIIVSRDTDLLPALETVTQLGLARVEVAAWRRSSRLNFPGQRLPWCHQLDGWDYDAIRDTTDYLKDRP